MAILTNAELRKIRNVLERKMAGAAIDYGKSEINAAAQAVEDLLISNAAVISSAIDTATSPYVFTNAQKKIIVAVALLAKYVRDI